MYQQPPNLNQNVPTYTPPQQPYSQYPQPPPQGYSAYPPPPYPQYNQPPSMPPKRKRRVWPWIVGAILALIVISAALGNQNTPQTSSTPPATEQPTAPPVPSPAALTNVDDIKTEVQNDITAAALTGDIIQAGYGKHDNAFALVGLNPPLTMSKDEQLTLVENDCFLGQKAIWTDLLLSNIGSMEVFVYTQDSQGLPVSVGDCILHPNTASKIDWYNTDAATAWNNKVYQNMTP
jgi:hypothetical protein